MRGFVAALAGVFLLVGLANTASAGIKVELPRAVSADELVQIFGEEGQNIPGLIVDISEHGSYKPGSVQIVAERFFVNVKDASEAFGFKWHRSIDLHAVIVLEVGEQYTTIELVSSRHAYGEPGDYLTTDNWMFEDVKEPFEELLRRVYARLGVE